jgi:hypothetical protein
MYDDVDPAESSHRRLEQRVHRRTILDVGDHLERLSALITALLGSGGQAHR